jgi:transposase
MIKTAENFKKMYFVMSRKQATEILCVSKRAMTNIMNHYDITRWPTLSEQERHRGQQQEAAETAAASSEL